MFEISTMTNLDTELLTRPGAKHDEEMSICSSTPPPRLTGKSGLKMSKSHLSNLSNLYERNEHFLNETTIENTTNIGTIDEFMVQNQRTYVVNQDNKHRLEDLCND